MVALQLLGASLDALGLLEHGLTPGIAAAQLARDRDARIHGVQAADKPVVPDAGGAVVPLHLRTGRCGLGGLVLLHAAGAVGDIVLVRVLPRKEVGVIRMRSAHRKTLAEIIANLFTLRRRHFGKKGRKAGLLGCLLDLCRLPTISLRQKTLFNFFRNCLLIKEFACKFMQNLKDSIVWSTGYYNGN